MAVLHVVTEPDALAVADAGATLRCQIVDVSQADADPVIVIATAFELGAERLAHNEDGVVQLTIELDLDADDIVLTPGRHYTIIVHIDQAGDEIYAPGDLLTTQSYPLPPGLFDANSDGHVEAVTVALTRI